LLNQAKADSEAKLHTRIEDNIRKLKATLSIIDGWSLLTNRPLTNAMLVSSSSEAFLGLMDTSGVVKNTAYLVEVLEKFIKEISPNNVVQVTMNNTNNIIFIILKVF